MKVRIGILFILLVLSVKTYEGCPSKSWTFLFYHETVYQEFYVFNDVFIYIWVTRCTNMGDIAVLIAKLRTFT